MAASDLEWPRVHTSSPDRARRPEIADRTDGSEQDVESVSFSPNCGSHSDVAPVGNQDFDGPLRLPSPSVTYSSEEDASPHKATNGENSEVYLAETPLPVLSRQAIAQRLARIARLLATTSGDQLLVDDLALVEQVNGLEIILMGDQYQHMPMQHRGTEPDLTSQPDIPVSEPPPNDFPIAPPTIVAPRSNIVAASAMQLSADLTTLLDNLRARHEESTHVHNVLVSRLERAAQRILFLQRHVQTLEDRLEEHDHEFANLRVLVKALEIQVPEHPDAELRRCLGKVKQELRVIRLRRNAPTEARNLMFRNKQDGPRHEEIDKDDK